EEKRIATEKQKEKEAKKLTEEKENQVRIAKEKEAKKAKEPVYDETIAPETTMSSWIDLSVKEKRLLIAHSIAFEIYSQKERNTPVKAVGSIDEFITVINYRYEEIQGLTNNYERLRMSGTTVAGQVGVMGYQARLFEW